MQEIIVGVWIFQGILMFFDEFVFHRRRGLGQWEKIGHPIDTLFFLIPFLIILFSENEKLFMISSIISTLMITKDEFIHSRECDSWEQWLHSLLFIIHPIALISLWVAGIKGYHEIVYIQSIIVFLFLSYQIIYWSFFYGKVKD